MIDMKGRSRTCRKQSVTNSWPAVGKLANFCHDHDEAGQKRAHRFGVGAVGAHDESTVPDGRDPAEEQFPLVIAVTPSPAERIRLAERLEGVAPLLLVSDLDELRRLIAAPQRLPPASSGPPPAAAPEAADGTLLIDSARSTARCRDREVGLTRLEHDLLISLTTEPIRVWSYAELHRTVWRDEGLERRADVQSLVKRLRRKLAGLGTGVTIDAVRGVGFRLTEHQQPRVSGS
ncbi:winged helix-turn-helix domain-containing protein [Micromonospora sp. NPDC052213]|uniref:winged helix-turn-helix domain-containing protein n=1 Tax=Micromonospora sp. NPDC052213 TaxID=3155812 RepID=UPI00341D4D56